MPRTRTDGWTVTVTHPTTSREISPDVLDEPQFTPSLNSLPEIRVPVRQAPGWLTDDFNDDPDMAVSLDGQELPIDRLRDVEYRQDRTILIGEGGAELTNRVQAEYQSEQRPQAVRDLITNNTSYATDVDDTQAAVDQDVTAQDPSGEADLQQLLEVPDTLPLRFTGGGVKPAQTCFTREGEAFDRSSGTVGPGSDSNASSGSYYIISNDGGSLEWDFDVGYTIPANDILSQYRIKLVGVGDNSIATFDVYIDGELIIEGDTPTSFSNWEWNTTNDNNATAVNTPLSDLAPIGNPHTLRFERASDTSQENLGIDVVAPADGRFSYTLDNDNGGSGGYLDGPETRPDSVDAEFDPFTTAFSVISGDVTADLTDTSNQQALALSNDFGASYPISGSNTASVSGDFPDAGSAINLKATLGRYSPSGAQSATPRFGYDSQRLDGYTLQADISFEALLIDDKYDNDLKTILNDIAGEQYIWSYQIQNGTPTLAWTEPEQRIADRDPELEDAQITKKGETWDSVTIKGANVTVSNEQFTASTSFTALTRDDLLTGSESVYDPGTSTQFERGTDYEMDYSAGEIRILSGGNMSSGSTYQIDYRYEVSGTHNVVSTPSHELVETIPAVVSERQAQQLAYVVAEVEPEVNTPRYEGQLVVPRVNPTFDPLEALQLDSLDLPDAARPLSIRGQPEVTPRGLVFNLGSAPPLEAQLSQLRDQVSAVSDRV